MSCLAHPYLMTCACQCESAYSMDAMKISEATQGTKDLDTSLYSEIDETILAGPVGPYNYNFTAPVADMTSKLRIDTGFKMMNAFTPFITTMQHDFYSERLALSPEDRPIFYVGRHYSDEFALSPPFQRKYSMNFALSSDKPPACPTPNSRLQEVVSGARTPKRDESPLKPSDQANVPEAPGKSKKVEEPKEPNTTKETKKGQKKEEKAKDRRAKARKKREEIQRVSREAVKAIVASMTEAAPPRSSRKRKAPIPTESSLSSGQEMIEPESRRSPREKKAKLHFESSLTPEDKGIEQEAKARRSIRPRKARSYIESSSDSELSTIVVEIPRSRKRKHQPEGEAQEQFRKSRRTRRTVKVVNYAE